MLEWPAKSTRSTSSGNRRNCLGLTPCVIAIVRHIAGLIIGPKARPRVERLERRALRRALLWRACSGRGGCVNRAPPRPERSGEPGSMVDAGSRGGYGPWIASGVARRYACRAPLRAFPLAFGSWAADIGWVGPSVDAGEVRAVREPPAPPAGCLCDNLPLTRRRVRASAQERSCSSASGSSSLSTARSQCR